MLPVQVSETHFRIIESVEEITNNADLFGNTTLRVVRSFLATDIWEQAGQGTLIIGLKLHQEEGNDTIADTDLFNVETPTDADVNLTDTAIFLDEDLLNGICLFFLLYLSKVKKKCMLKYFYI